MLTTDRQHPDLNTPKGEGMQNKVYLVLSEEEIAEGFVRPIRNSYVHIGKNVNAHWKSIHRMLDDEEKKEHPDKNYVAVMTILTNDDGTFKGGTYVTQEELDAWKSHELLGGCGTKTLIAREIAETYARNPHFYGATWCMGCGKHLPVNEFIWDDDSEDKVGE